MKELSTFVLENGALSVIISPVGAELQSVVCDGVERMWSGDPAVWGRRVSLLFPLIGRLRDGWYANGAGAWMRRCTVSAATACLPPSRSRARASVSRRYPTSRPGRVSSLPFPVDRRLLARGFLDRQVAYR